MLEQTSVCILALRIVQNRSCKSSSASTNHKRNEGSGIVNAPIYANIRINAVHSQSPSR